MLQFGGFGRVSPTVDAVRRGAHQSARWRQSDPVRSMSPFFDGPKQHACMDNDRSLAMLVDGDNASHNAIKAIIDEASKHGNLKIRRVYGDWTNQNLAKWKEAANLNAMQLVQQSSYTSGKNSTDGALIIDAMDILYTDDVDGFCIVSSDSDYTRLAIKLREHGKTVFGIGEKKTPKSLVNACHQFTYTEMIVSGEPLPDSGVIADQDAKRRAEWVALVKNAIEESPDENEWVLLAEVGQRLRTINPAFDARAYGSKSLHSLIESEPDKFDLKSNERDGVLSGHLVRLKPTAHNRM